MVGEDSDRKLNSESKLVISTSRSGESMVIRLKDTGTGIAENDLEKVLEPLFSTKGFGVGLGLSAVSQIVEQHFGELKIKSKINRGTTITLIIPCKQAKEDASRL
jgi:two-component system sporulation sensor kinase A